MVKHEKRDVLPGDSEGDHMNKTKVKESSAEVKRGRRYSHSSDRRKHDRRKSGSSNRGDGQERQRRSRASGEILELLMSEFSKCSNPSSEVRKFIAGKTGMTERSVRIWFQNRRAKQRKLMKMKEKQQADMGESGAGLGASSINRGSIPSISGPLEINEKYSLIDCRSLSVGQWQRIRSGSINTDSLSKLHNLSPQLVNHLMDSTDLVVILSKKDHELNYFFSGVFQNERVLFRIFFPLVNVARTSFIDNQTQKANSTTHTSMTSSSHAQLQMELSAPPKFAVHFLKDPSTGHENANKWSICEDFSEGQQVATAHIGENGTGIPHILTGSLLHLQYLNTAILSCCREYAQSTFPGPSAEPQLFQPTPLAQQPTSVNTLVQTPAEADNILGIGTMDVDGPADALGIGGETYQLDNYQSSNGIPLVQDPSPFPVSLNVDVNGGKNLESSTNTSLSLDKSNTKSQSMSPGLDIFQSPVQSTAREGDHLTPFSLMLTSESPLLGDQPSSSNPGSSEASSKNPQKDYPNVHKVGSEFESTEFFMDDNGANDVQGLGF